MDENILTTLDFIPKVKGQRVILGIDGLSRSGKTTFVKKLTTQLEERHIPVCVIHMDNYIVEKSKRYHTGFHAWYEYYHLQWDKKTLKEQMFDKLKKEKNLELLTYHHQLDLHHQQELKIPDTCLIIIEGVFLQRREWRDYFDYLIFLDCPREKRFAREREEIQKDIEKFQNRYWKAEENYLASESPIQRADLVIHC